MYDLTIIKFYTNNYYYTLWLINNYNNMLTIVHQPIATLLHV